MNPRPVSGVSGALLVAVLSFTACKSPGATTEKLPSPTGSALPAPAIPELQPEPSAGSAAAAAAADGIRGTGSLHPTEEAQLGPKATGVLTHIAVDEGDRVKKGQLLFRIDSRQASLAVEQAKTAVAAAKVSRDAAKLDYTRTKELSERGAIAPAVLDQSKARYDGALAGVAQAEVSLSLARRMASDTSVRSPISGVVTMRLKSVGETVTMMPPTVVLVVQDLRKLELRARLPERALAVVDVGAELQVRFPALGSERKARIARIQPTVDARTRTVEVIAELDNADGKLRPGMLAEIDVGGALPAAPAPNAPTTASEKRAAP